MLQEIKAFLTKSNALALAIGVIIGAATGKVVSAIVEDLLMPVIGVILPAGGWQNLAIELPKGGSLKYGHFLGTVLDFIIIAWIVFLITKALLRPAPEPPAPPTKVCPECLETIPAEARKCRACGSSQAEAVVAGVQPAEVRSGGS